MSYVIQEETKNTMQLLDATSYNHCVHTSEIAREFEVKFHLEDNLLSQAAFLHDIGKIYIPSKILMKPGRLSVLERQVIDLHPYMGYQILKNLGEAERICSIVLYHHGLMPPILQEVDTIKDSDVKAYALMLHTIDAFEALTTDRAYRRGYTPREAVEIMDKESRHDKKVLDFLNTHSFYE